MNRRLSLVVVMLALAFVVGGSAAYAQDVVTGNIPFKFMASGRQHDPGVYELRLADDEATVMLTPEKAKGGSGTVMPVETRLAMPASAAKAEEARLVFDKVGDTYYLSEVWFPGLDGCATYMTKQKHTHEVIKVTRRPKAK